MGFAMLLPKDGDRAPLTASRPDPEPTAVQVVRLIAQPGAQLALTHMTQLISPWNRSGTLAEEVLTVDYQSHDGLWAFDADWRPAFILLDPTRVSVELTADGFTTSQAGWTSHCAWRGETLPLAQRLMRALSDA